VILADTSVWVDHLRRGEPHFVTLLREDGILIHPFVIGEIALGYLDPRDEILAQFYDLPFAAVAADEEVVALVGHQKLFGTGIGYVDAHLLASVRLTPNAALWTKDQRLHAVADRLGIAARID
jgi:predicted nucleic acid-binding protein